MDVRDSDRGDFRRRRAVDTFSYYYYPAKITFSGVKRTASSCILPTRSNELVLIAIYAASYE